MNLELNIAGMGLVSPAATSPREHAFFIRADSTIGSPRAFFGADGEALDVIHCPWVDPHLGLRERMELLARRALETALPTVALAAGTRIPAMLCCRHPDAAFSDEDAAAVEAALSASLAVDFGPRHGGAAGVFTALQVAHQWLESAAAVAIVAVDSFCSAEAVKLVPNWGRPRRWERVPSYLSEAAAAVVVTRPGLPSLGTIRSAGVAAGEAHDDNDVIVDGVAMTRLVAQAAGAPITQSFGQHNVDALRSLSWSFAVSRNKELFTPTCRIDCVEDSMGRVGAAAGGVHLVYGLATELHGTAAHSGGGSFASWAISRKGLRGLCIGRGPT